MNVETKYIIRWGIPGWVFILFLSIMIYLIFHPSISLKDVNLVDILGLLVSAGFVGVPVGYLFHQLYFSYNWLGKRRLFDPAINLIEKKELIKNKCWGQNAHKDYFRLEYIWQQELFELENDKRTYLSERYRHFLNTIHGLGALWISLAFSLAINLVFFVCYFGDLTKISLLFLIALELFMGYLLLAVHKGFNYYSDNLNHFQGYFLNYLLNKNESDRNHSGITSDCEH